MKGDKTDIKKITILVTYGALSIVFIIAMATLLSAYNNIQQYKTSPSPFKIWEVGNQSYLFSGAGGLGCIDTVQNVSYVGGYETGGLFSECVPIPNKGLNITATCVVTIYGTPLPPKVALQVLNKSGVSNNVICITKS